jgi:hypothetical protein
MKRGLLLLLAGTALNLLGMSLMKIDDHFTGQKMLYGWSMIAGVILFGAGFLYILYSLIRKVERHAILEERAERN